ncbi:putative FAD-containing monooxygenase MymA [Amycolatopsis deserti]|uniref:FAD-containing monooxygenase MymA n=1 Tax=Amycolatopsis deserti TaxID=185696 RepID=A0ABQ3ICX1_9PSEU|nr:NAD(P)/FAD-dependent oxidoreductase [Amycolatopsis deserti]GHE76082.1 putative FAD-containing monooxygenase MymA [Amycolatopsis deserti]
MNTHTNVLVIGAGVSGIGVASRLRKEFPERTLAVLERRERIGGTWDLFRYPGVRSDSDMFTFGYELRPWNELKVLADGTSIRNYVVATAKQFGVEQLISYGRKVVGADWSSTERRWTVTSLIEATGETETRTCDFLVTATGYYDYDNGYQPDFPGADQFQGQLVHPQHWPEGLDYSGKKVVVIGSGATAITLVPAMAKGGAGHVTMLQRSPTYVMSLPSVDKMTAVQRRFLPRHLSDRLTRARNIAVWRATYFGSRRFPALSRALLLRGVRKHVGDDYDMTHFSPTYNPWDQRLCAVPDGDLFTAITSGKASVVTDTIEAFTPKGILLTSGQELEADIIVSATGLSMQPLGGAVLSVDGVARQLKDGMTYKSVMLEDVPNLAWVFGYTNISWTLKVDLASSYLVRLLKEMDATHTEVVTPVDRGDNATDASVADGELTAGYILRAAGELPRQGRGFPWRMVMDYKHDRKVLLEDPIDDGILEFTPARTAAVAQTASA